MKNYAGLLTRLHNTPLLMSLEKVRVITEAVTIPLLFGQADLIERVPDGATATTREYASEFASQGRSVAIISVFDSLVSKNISAGSGMTSYQSITAKIDDAIEAGATDIGFYIDSPGGEVSVFGLSEKIRRLPERGINTFSFCDMACSAAYAIAAATQRIYASPVAQSGSIAAIAVHMDITKQVETEGKTYTVFRSKDQKALGDPYTKLGEAEVDYFTSLLATLDTVFNNDVVQRENLSLETVKLLAGKSLIGQEALTAGLIDAVVPNLENALSLFLEDSKLLQSQRPKGVLMATPEELQTQLDAANTKITSLEGNTVEAVATALTEEIDRVQAILTVAQTLKLDLAVAQKYTDSKYSLEIATEILTDLAASKDAAVELNTSTGVPKVLPEGATENNSETLRAAFKTATNL